MSLVVLGWEHVFRRLRLIYSLLRTNIICSSCNMGTSDLPELYALALGLRPHARTYISGKSQVPMLQLVYSTWVTHLQMCMETAGMLCKSIYMGPCEFRLWITS